MSKFRLNTTPVNNDKFDIVADGNHLLADKPEGGSGRFNVRGSGVFGGASITLGFDDGMGFVPYDDGGPFTDVFSLQASGGELSNMYAQVASMSGTTDVALVVSELS